MIHSERFRFSRLSSHKMLPEALRVLGEVDELGSELPAAK